MASKILFALMTSLKSSYKTQQNGVCLSCIGRCIAEIIDQEIRPPCMRLNRASEYKSEVADDIESAEEAKVLLKKL